MTMPAPCPPSPSLEGVFRAKAESGGARVRLAADERAAAEVVAAAAPRAAATAALAAWFAGDAPGFAPARAASRGHGAEPALEVVTGAVFGIAETGSVVLREASAADRGACWLAERLFVLLRAEALEPSLDEGLARVARLVGEGAPYVTLVSGPSRTADIERVLTIGVHGPREVTVVLVGGGTRG